MAELQELKAVVAVLDTTGNLTGNSCSHSDSEEASKRCCNPQPGRKIIEQ
jgi:hypothetical protein